MMNISRANNQTSGEIFEKDKMETDNVYLSSSNHEINCIFCNNINRKCYSKRYKC